MYKNVDASSLKFAKTKQTCAASIPPNPMEISVHTVFEKHPTRMCDHDPSINIDKELHKEQNGPSSSLDADVDSINVT